MSKFETFLIKTEGITSRTDTQSSTHWLTTRSGEKSGLTPGDYYPQHLTLVGKILDIPFRGRLNETLATMDSGKFKRARRSKIS